MQDPGDDDPGEPAVTDGNLNQAGSAATAAAPSSDLLVRLMKPNPLLVAVVWLFVVTHFVSSWTTVGNVFNDTDDAMRLVEVRDFLAGQSWFDLHQYRLDPPAGLPMHWSRFVDLPIAVLVRLAELVVSPAMAERVAMYLWPTLVLIPALLAVRRIACRLGGDWAALPALYLTATCSPAISQFVPGRIDHHNVQIALTLWLLAVLFDPPAPARGVRLAVISAVMMAVGMETLPFVVFAALAVCQRLVFTEDGRAEAMAYGAALAAATLAAMVGTLPMKLWTWGACDALSANYVGLSVVGGLGLAAVAALAPKRPVVRAAGLAVVAALALVAFAVPEPACLRGPFAQILPEVRAVWLDGVTEIQPWWVFFSEHHVDALVALIAPMVAAVATLVLAREPETRRSVPFWLIVASAALATVIGLFQIRTIIYADILSLPLIAAAIGRAARQSEVRGRTATVTVLVGTVLASSSLATFVVGKLAPASWTAEPTAASAGAEAASSNTAASPVGAGAGKACMTLSNYADLARLPPGLVAAEINLGPSILAGTPHSVVTAPYHRMQRGILDGDHMLRWPPEAALKVMDARRVDYVVLCKASVSAASAAETEPDSLLVHLMTGRVPRRLEEIPSSGTIRVFRVLPATAFAANRPEPLTHR